VPPSRHPAAAARLPSSATDRPERLPSPFLKEDAVCGALETWRRGGVADYAARSCAPYSHHWQKQTQVCTQPKNLKSSNRISPKNLSSTWQWGVLSISDPLHLPSCAPKPTQHGQLANPITRESLKGLQKDRINPTHLRQSRAIAINVNHSYISYLHN